MSQVIREVRENKREDLTLFMKAVRDDVSNVCEAFKSGQSQEPGWGEVLRTSTIDR